MPKFAIFGENKHVIKTKVKLPSTYRQTKFNTKEHTLRDRDRNRKNFNKKLPLVARRTTHNSDTRHTALLFGQQLDTIERRVCHVPLLKYI